MNTYVLEWRGVKERFGAERLIEEKLVTVLRDPGPCEAKSHS